MMQRFADGSPTRDVADATRRGVVSVEFLREILVIMGIVLLVVQCLSGLGAKSGALENDQQAAAQQSNEEPIYRLSAVNDGTVWMLKSNHQVIRVNLATGEEFERVDLQGRGAGAVAFSTDGKSAIILGLNQEFLVIRNGEVTSISPPNKRGLGTEVAMTTDGQLAASIHEIGMLRLYDCRSSAVKTTSITVDNGPTVVRFSPDDKQLVVANASGKLSFHHPVTGEQTQELRLPGIDRITGLAWSPDSSQIAIGDGRGYVALVAVNSLKVIAQRRVASLQAASLCFSPNGATIAIGSFDPQVRVVSSQDLELLESLPGHESLVRSMIYLPTGELATGGLDGRIKLSRPKVHQLLEEALAQNSSL